MESRVEQYLECLQLKGCSADTLMSRRRSLGLLIRYCKKKYLDTWGDVDEIFMKEYIYHLRGRSNYNYPDKKLKEITIWNYKAHIYRFFIYLEHEGFILSNPMTEDLLGRKTSYSYRYPPSYDKIRQVFNEVAYTSPYPQRDRAIFELAYGSGLRLSEMVGLDLEDYLGESVRVLGKGGKYRLSPLTESCRMWFNRYLVGERSHLVSLKNPHERAFFVNKSGYRLTRSGFIHRIRKIKGVHFHLLRHACATHMLQNGACILSIQELLGHRSIKSTELYTRLTQMDTLQMLENYHPRR